MNCSISFQRDVINSGVYVINVYFADMFCVSFKPKSLPSHSSAAQLSQSGANSPLRKIIIQKVIKLIDQGSDFCEAVGIIKTNTCFDAFIS